MVKNTESNKLQNSDKLSPKNSTGTRKRGRPKLSEEQKRKPRHLTYTDTAQIGLEKTCNILGIDSISELNEQIGTKKLKVVRANDRTLEAEISSIPICRRAKGLVEQPIAVFGSILGYTWRRIKQLKIITESSRDELAYEVVRQAIEIMVSFGYTNPNNYINNPSAVIKTNAEIILKTIAAENQYQHSSQSEFINYETRQVILWKACDSYRKLNDGSRSLQLTILKMKTLNGMTLGQIKKIVNEQGEDLTEEEVRLMVKKGLVTLREFVELPYGEVVTHNAPPKAEQYLQLASQNYLTPSEQNTLEVLLSDAEYDAYLDFWLNEIDYHVGEELFKLDISNYRNCQEQIRSKIYQYIQNDISINLKKLSKTMAFCYTQEDILKALKTHIRITINIQFPLEFLLNKKWMREKEILEQNREDLSTNLQKEVSKTQKILFFLEYALSKISEDSSKEDLLKELEKIKAHIQ